MSALVVAIFLCALAIGCSNASTPIEPVSNPEPALTDGGSHQAELAGNNILGVYGFEFDEKSMTVTTLEMREAGAHFDVTAWVMPPACGGVGCLTYSITAWDPINRILDLNATLQNPTNLTAYDARLIFRFMIMRSIVNVDSYTPNFVPVGEINPFIAFAKASPTRTFGPSPTAITETVKIHWPVGAGGFIINVVEGCWPGHCAEPYEINTIGTTGPIYPGGSTTISCNVLDWQSDVAWVRVDTTPITGGWTNLTNTSGTTWSANVTNSMGAPAGDYTCWIRANSNPAGPPFSDLYHKIVIKIRIGKWAAQGVYQLPQGPCTTDIGVIGSVGGAFDSHILITGDDPAHGASPCDALIKYAAHYGPSAMYKSLVNLDPLNNTYQPWPPERIDATNDNAAGWNNANTMAYVQPGYTPAAGIANMYIYSNIDQNANFTFAWPNDHRHFLGLSPDGYDYFPIDVCDDFQCFQHALMVDFSSSAMAMGFEGAPGGNYHNNDIIFYGPITTGTGGCGKVEPGYDIGGIDVYQISAATARMLILEHGSDWAVEAFDITNTAPGWGIDQVQWAYCSTFTTVEPIDIEILPPKASFAPNPNKPTYCVLVDNWPSGGTGGDIWFYDCVTNSYVGSLSSLGTGLPSPPIQNTPQFIDIDDGAFEIHVMEAGPIVEVFKWV
jgi:hypothetical protein